MEVGIMGKTHNSDVTRTGVPPLAHRGLGGVGSGEDTEGAGEGMGVKDYLLGLLMRAVSAGGLSKMSYAAAAVGRGFVKGGVSRLLQPVVTVWVMGGVGHRDQCPTIVLGI